MTSVHISALFVRSACDQRDCADSNPLCPLIIHRHRMSRMRAASRARIDAAASTASDNDINPDPAGLVGP